ncbi:MAG: DciA family protein [Flavobacteriaceae bacterium]|nr:DciA family protein [Flavobacteriaceae bacterium]
MKKKREFHSSELVKNIAKIYGFEEVLISLKIKTFLKEYLDEDLFNEIESVRLKDKTLTIKIKSPLLKNDFKMRKSFYLNKISETVKEATISDMVIF